MIKQFLTKFKAKHLAMSEKNRTFAPQEEEPTALAFTDFTDPSPILEGESARIFLENVKKAEENAEKRRNEPPSIEALKDKLAMYKLFLEQDIDNVKKRYKKICDLEDKIKLLEKENDKAEEK